MRTHTSKTVVHLLAAADKDKKETKDLISECNGTQQQNAFFSQRHHEFIFKQIIKIAQARLLYFSCLIS